MELFLYRLQWLSQMLFGVRDTSDSAIPLLKELQQAYPYPKASNLPVALRFALSLPSLSLAPGWRTRWDCPLRWEFSR